MSAGTVRRGVRTLAWNQGLRLGEFGFMFLSSLLYARWLGPAEYGRYALIVAISGMLPLIVGFGLDEALSSFTARIAAAGCRAQQVWVFRVAVLVRAGTGMALALLLWTEPALVARLAGDPQIAGDLRLAIPYLIGNQLFTLLLNAALGRLASGAATVARLASLAGGFALSVALLRAGLGVGGVMLGVGSAASAAALWLLWRDRALLRGPAERVPLSPIWQFGWTTWLLNIANYVLGKQLDLFLLSVLLGQASLLGLYNVGLGLTTMIGSLFIAGLGGAALPLYSGLAARRDDRGLASLWRANIVFVNLLGIPIGVFAMAAGPYLIERLYGGRFSAAVIPFEITMALATVSRALGGGASSTLLYAKDGQKRLLIIRGVAAAANILLDVTLIPRLGLAGAALATGSAGLGIVVAEFLLARRAAPLIFPRLATVRISIAALAPAAPIWRFLPADPLSLLIAGAGYTAGFCLILAILRPFGEEDLLLADRIHPRARRLLTPFVAAAAARERVAPATL